VRLPHGNKTTRFHLTFSTATLIICVVSTSNHEFTGSRRTNKSSVNSVQGSLYEEVKLEGWLEGFFFVSHKLREASGEPWEPLSAAYRDSDSDKWTPRGSLCTWIKDHSSRL